MQTHELILMGLEEIQGVLKVIGKSGGDLSFAGVVRMFKLKGMGMKHLAWGMVTGGVNKRACGATTVQKVAGERATDVFEMNANLVGATGV